MDFSGIPHESFFTLIGVLVVFFIKDEIKGVFKESLKRVFGASKKEAVTETDSGQLVEIAKYGQETACAVAQGNELKERMLKELCRDHLAINKNIKIIDKKVEKIKEAVIGIELEELEERDEL